MPNDSKKAICPLCGGDSDFLCADRKRTFLKCESCRGIWVPEAYHLDAEAELARYQLHRNDIHDTGYRDFVRPLVDAVLSRFDEKSKGLDFGSGPGPVAAVMLADAGRQTILYDPFFHPDTQVLNDTYDYIICIEVAEHFRQPAESFGLLASLLKPKGILFLMTDLTDNVSEFQKWYYKNDMTHVFFYQKRTFELFEELFGLTVMRMAGRLILLQKD